VTLPASTYLLVITQAKLIGKIHSSTIYRVEEVDFMSYKSASLLATNEDRMKDDYFISKMQELLDTKTFYFSYDYDLTHTLQRISSFTED
jgi:hypothetical protein